MINSIAITGMKGVNYIEGNNLGNINLIIGECSTGKTFILNLLYATIKAINEFQSDVKSLSEKTLLIRNLKEIFKISNLESLISLDSSSCYLVINQEDFEFNLYKTEDSLVITNKLYTSIDSEVFLFNSDLFSMLSNRSSVAFSDKLKEVLTLKNSLACNSINFVYFRTFINTTINILNTLIGGRLEFEEKWMFKKENQLHPIETVSDGIKRIALLEILLRNNYITKNSVVFIDNIEAFLHPSLLIKLLDVIESLSTIGVQFFISSHSIFVLKKLQLISLRKNVRVSIISSIRNGVFKVQDLSLGTPNNSIIDEYINLYKEEIELAFK